VVKYPNIGVNLMGVDGNAFSLIGSVSDALRRGGVSRDIISEFRQEATSGDYDNVLATIGKWVRIDLHDESDDDDYDARYCGWCDELHEDCECDDED
jgi:hypothetical protein